MKSMLKALARWILGAPEGVFTEWKSFETRGEDGCTFSVDSPVAGGSRYIFRLFGRSYDVSAD